MARSSLEDSLYFLKRFIRGPRRVASVWPSSRYLAQRMFAGISLGEGDLVIEYGPGTGAFTTEIERLRASGVGVRYLGVEKDRGMYEFLVDRFPALDFAHGDAVDVVEHCAARALPPASAIISGLPLIFLDLSLLRAIIDATGACLEPNGVFRTFSYVHSYPTRGADDLRVLMSRSFEHYELGGPVIRNLPPAFTLTGRTPVRDVGVESGEAVLAADA